ncbi:MAG: S9 family peptidase [Alistipes sp.]|nr:S9 family peptidase [Alistipes sp.]MBR5893437.1 S9 family peptidase [Bacteroidaceae bacterium]
MKKILNLLLAAMVALPMLADGNLSLRNVMDGTFYPERYYSIVPMNDGEHFARMSNDRKMVLQCSFKSGEVVDTLFDASTARGFGNRHIDGYTFSPDESRMLIQTNTVSIYRRSFTAEHYIYSRKNNKVEALSQNGAQQVPKFSPDGTMIAFVRDNNIFIVKLLFNNSESQVTTDGEFGKIINGVPDWVYEEEFSTNCSYDWSADSKMLAFIRYDESEVMNYDMPMYIPSATKTEYDPYVKPYSYKYPVAGADNSKVSVHTFDVKSRTTQKIKLEIDSESYIPRIQFTSSPDVLAVITLNRHQSVMDVFAANPRSGLCKRILREESDTYLNEKTFTGIHFYEKNFILHSERSGYNHLYLYNINGDFVRPITQGEYEITEFFGWDQKKNLFYYASNEGSPLRNNVYKISAKGKKTRLTMGDGTNSAVFSSGLKYFINTFDNITTPHIVTSNDNNGKVLRTLVDNKKLNDRLAGMTLPQKEFFAFTTSDGVSINGWMIKPHDFDASKQYPVVMYQYSGPYSQEVTDSWYTGMYPGAAFEAYMCEQGFIMVCVDGRGTGGRGTEFGKCTYLKLGYYEPRDQVEAAKYLGSLPYVDKENIGIWGWSFGGYNTIMSMSQKDAVFKAGVAIAAPTDWRFYDTVYTERYMRTPKENKEGYDLGSAVQHAADLNGKLLLIHGTADDNVHFRNMLRYAHAVNQAGKMVEMALYPDSNHSIYFGARTRMHVFERLSKFFIENLK